MSFETLRLFRDIVQNRSLSRAAGGHGITPSAASQQLQELERALGVQLLDRSTRPMSLTAAGKLYHELCRDVLRRYDEFEVAVNDLKGKVEGAVRVASIYSVGISEMSRLEAELNRRAPEVTLEVEYLRPEKVYEAVTSDRADLGLVSYPEATREIAVIPWREEEMALACSPRHALALRPQVGPEDLEGVEFVAFDPELPIHDHIAAYLQSGAPEPNVVLHFDNLQTIKEAVELNSGVSIVPVRVLRAELEQGRLAAVPLRAPGLHRPLGIIHRKKKRFNRAAQLFLELVQEAPGAEAREAMARA
ncbi:MAG: LysR family transcriptional regulator [Acidobacteria bacterium]|nr:LysR family transcriptional regulator [Acidobacteriota bacterium]